MPAYLVEQWADTITQFSDRFRIMIYHGSEKSSKKIPKAQLQSDGLRRTNLLDGREDWASTLILTSYQTLTVRHGRTTLLKGLKSYIQQHEPQLSMSERNEEAERLLEDLDAEPCASLSQNLRGCFERVIIDEAHEVRNQLTQASWTIQSLRAKFHILLTATPFLNSIEDVSGLMRILRPNEEELWGAQNLARIGIIDGNGTNEEQELAVMNFNPWKLSDSDPGHDLRWTSISLRRHVFAQRITMAEKGALMRGIFKECILKRGYPSKIDGRRIGDELPPVQNITIYLKFTESEKLRYDPIFQKYVKRLFRKKGDDIVYDTNSFRLLTLVTSWLDFERLAASYKVKHLKGFRKKGGSAMTILNDLLLAQRKAGVCTKDQIFIPNQEDVQKTLELFANGSPKLRYLLLIIGELHILKKEKIIIFVTLPAQQMWLECVSFSFNFFIRCRSC